MRILRKSFNLGFISFLYLAACEILFLVGVCSKSSDLVAYSLIGGGLHLLLFASVVLFRKTITKHCKLSEEDLAYVAKIQDVTDNCVEKLLGLGTSLELWAQLVIALVFLFLIPTKTTRQIGLIVLSLALSWSYIYRFLNWYLGNLYETAFSHLDQIPQVERAALDALKKKSYVEFHAQADDSAESESQGQEFFHIAKLSCSFGLEDSDLELFSNFKRLKELTLVDCRISSKGLSELYQFLPEESDAAIYFCRPNDLARHIYVFQQESGVVTISNNGVGWPQGRLTFESREEAQEYLENLSFEP